MSSSSKRKPIQSGVVIYANDLKRVANFYAVFLGLNCLKETSELISLGNETLAVVIHTPPVPIPQPNFNTVKPFFTVENFEQARASVIELGGEALPGEWSNPIFKICNIADPEGNVIQLREMLV